ncbi:MAG TPA: IPTL-CTERM sorting domain-containing protein [Thermoanaerobaculia bacterium]|nr:IPTL-CTERM sorting domain-containing protein [Thermoanaerobaculia bacterium]
MSRRIIVPFLFTALSVFTAAANAADLRIYARQMPPILDSPGHATVNVGVQNIDVTPADNLTLTVTITGAGSVTFNPIGGSCITSGGAGSATAVCTYPSIAPFAEIPELGMSITAGPGIPAVTLTATVTSTTPDLDPANNTIAGPVAFNYADASVTKSGPASANAGSDVTYHLAVSGSGSTDSPSMMVTLTDTLPSELSFVSLTQTGGPTFACTTGQTVSCSRGVPFNGTGTFDLVARINAAGGTISNTASVAMTGLDPISANNSATAVTAIIPAPVPTLSEWSLIALGIALAVGGALLIRR